ncbi:MAG: sigma-70 family RNA polymerase sigma factor [Clostridiales bacterium]|nr:sigma-70 family RNA polymerase sigma factor [Clostridiales bacterium]
MNADLIHDTAMAYALNPTEETMEAATVAALPLCHAIAARFSGRGIEIEDLRQVAAVALISALKGFDPQRGLRFTTYVTPTMIGTIRNHIRDKAQLVRSPRGLRERGIQMDRMAEKLTQELNREPLVFELADALGWEIQQVLDVQSMREKSQFASFDAPDENGLMLFDKLGGEEIGYDSFEAREDLKSAMKHLSNTEKKLLAYRYGERLSQQATAQKLNMTQMQVSRMERRILTSLKQEMTSV